MANRTFTQFQYSLHKMPVLLDCNFVVDSTNGNGLGIRSLKGPGIQNVYMNTSATPAAGNPNPQAGVIVVQLQDNYNRSFSGGYAIVSPVSGTPLAVDGSALTVGHAYTIVSVGTTTAADWVTLGLPVGDTAQVGSSFIALVAGTGSGSGMVEAPVGSGIATIETVGDPNTTLAPNSPNNTVGGQIILQCLNGSNALTAPTNGSVISLQFLLSNSSVMTQGE